MARNVDSRIVPPGEIGGRPIWKQYCTMKTTRSVDNLLAEIAAKGWSLNNLFQLADGMWRANLRVITEDRAQTRTYFHEYADASSAADALAAAIFNMQSRLLGKHDTAGIATVDYTPAVKRAMTENQFARAELQKALKAYRHE